MGRLFDAVAALVGVRQETNYEGQAAIELEALAAPDEEGSYPFPVPQVAQSDGKISPQEIDLAPCLKAVVENYSQGVPVPVISRRFHNGLAELVLQVSEAIRRATGVSTVALSGGVWQNMTLLRKATFLLEQRKYKVLIHTKVPANDGGIALGQAVVAFHRLNR